MSLDQTIIWEANSQIQGDIDFCQRSFLDDSIMQHIETYNKNIKNKILFNPNQQIIQELKHKLKQSNKSQKQALKQRLKIKNCFEEKMKILQQRIKQLQLENKQYKEKTFLKVYTSSKQQCESKLKTNILQLSEKLNQKQEMLLKLADSHSLVSNYLHKSLTEKKSLELKCQTIMQEFHSLKKQYEDEKVRSNEDQIKIRQLQHQIDKKDKMISQLMKEKLEIKEENNNLDVQVLKKKKKQKKQLQENSSK